MTDAGDRVAVLLMAYGTPATPDDIERYYTDIRRGRPPTSEQLADLTARYAALGGTSPLAARTEAQRTGLQRALDELAAGHFEVVLGFKHSEPRIETAVADIAARGHRRLVALVLAPHYSVLSVGEYHERALRAGAEHGLDIATIDSWATEPALVRFLAAEVRRSVDEIRSQSATAAAPDIEVVFTAHSLPRRVDTMGDPYTDELRSTASAVAREVGLEPGSGWRVAWQSAARTNEPWLGPDIVEVIAELAASRAQAGRTTGIVVCACGFVSDHLEVLYDLDIVAARRARELGIAFARTRCVNDDPTVMAALAARVADVA